MNAVVRTLEELKPLPAPASASNASDTSVEGARLAGMRIIFINRYFYPDVSATSQMLYDLTRRLVRQGAAVHVLCSQQRYDNPAAQLVAHEMVEGIHIQRVRTTQFGRDNLIGRACDYLSFYVAATYALLQLARSGDVLVAKTDPPLISLPVSWIARWRGAKLVNWLQDMFPEVASQLGTRLPKWLDKSLLRLRDSSLRSASANVVIGTRMREHLLNRGLDSAHIHIVENWADADLATPKPVASSALRLSLGLQNRFVVGYSGNLGRAHEYETILNAAIALRMEKDVVFLMTGGGAKMQQFKQAVSVHRLNNVMFQAYQPRELLADSMAAADVYLISLLPSLEGLIVPSKYYGILAAGRPAIVIGDTDGELARAVGREQCGECVRVGDWDALVSALWRMKLEPAYRHELGTRARSVFVERHTAEMGAELWLSLLATLKSTESSEQLALAKH